MGNRAYIITKDNDTHLYLHWHGGRDSVEAFLKYCEIKGYRAPSSDDYGWARLCQVIGNFFGGGLSIGISGGRLDREWATEDNGVYIIDGWQIVDRWNAPTVEQHAYDLKDMLVEIDKSQPKAEQLGEDFLRADEVPTDSLSIGDKVWIKTWDGDTLVSEVVGFKNGLYGRDSIPYVNCYGDDENEWRRSYSNELREDTVRIASRKAA